VRARHPDVAASVDRDGVTLGYEVFGAGETAVLLLPTWTIIHSRFWKMQVPYLARYYQVITYDGPGNGRTDRVTDPHRYSADSYAADAAAVLDACGVSRVVVVGVSLGAQYGVRLATLHPDRIAGLVMVGAALPLTPPPPERAGIADTFLEPYPENPRDWERYNLAYWHDHYEDFAAFFFRQVFSEPHSTKPQEDAIGWAMETTPDVLGAEANRPRPASEGTIGSIASPVDAATIWCAMLEKLACPVLLVHAPQDRIQPYAASVQAARMTGGTLVTMDGSGHMPNLRDPVRFNLILRRFIEVVSG